MAAEDIVNSNEPRGYQYTVDAITANANYIFVFRRRVGFFNNISVYSDGKIEVYRHDGTRLDELEITIPSNGAASDTSVNTIGSLVYIRSF